MKRPQRQLQHRVSRAQDRPAAPHLACGVAWLAWPENGDGAGRLSGCLRPVATRLIFGVGTGALEHDRGAAVLAESGTGHRGDDLGDPSLVLTLLGQLGKGLGTLALGDRAFGGLDDDLAPVAVATIEPGFDSVRRELPVLAIMSWSVGAFPYGATGLLVSLR